jgi:hypothetical protein
MVSGEPETVKSYGRGMNLGETKRQQHTIPLESIQKLAFIRSDQLRNTVEAVYLSSSVFWVLSHS